MAATLSRLKSELPTASVPGKQTVPPSSNVGLLSALGLFTTIMMVVGGVIGSGIFRKAGVMAGQVGSPEILLGVWLLAGVITLFGALTNAEVASIIPETGGQYIYFERMFGPFFAYLYGWAVFAVIQTGSIAAVAYVFAEYASQFVKLPEFSASVAAFSIHFPFIGDVAPLAEIGTKGVAAVLVVGLTAVNYVGVKLGGVVQNVFTIAKVAAMALLFLGAFLLPTGGTFSNLSTSSTLIHPTGFKMFLAVVAAMQGAFWAYDGWNKITYIAGEVKEPQRNIPLGLGIGMLIVIAIYMLINVAYAYVLPIDVMAHSKLVAADVAEKCFKGGGRWIAAAVMISTFGTANATILASARVYFSMSRRNVFPKFLGAAHPVFHTPAASLIVQGIWSVLLLFSGTFDTLTDTLIFVSWVFYAAGAYGVFVLRRDQPDTPRPYRVPGYPYVPWIFVIFAGVYLVFSIYNDVVGYQAAVAAGKPAIINSAFGMALVLIGTPIYWFYRMRARLVSKLE
ncbi:MAG: amino acid permease [Pedosphaera sp.]|nr:amino acid permease [Pedosphaera sp.]